MPRIRPFPVIVASATVALLIGGGVAAATLASAQSSGSSGRSHPVEVDDRSDSGPDDTQVDDRGPSDSSGHGSNGTPDTSVEPTTTVTTVSTPVPDDNGVDGPGHDANDDNGVDSATHDATDDNGVDDANHDATDDNGGPSDDQSGHGGSGHGGNDGPNHK